MKKYKYSEITPENIYKKRRFFIKTLGLGLGSLTLNTMTLIGNSVASTDQDKITSFEDITTYNNYYEFGTGKSDPYIKSQNFKTKPWTIKIEGEVDKPMEISVDEILSSFSSEERILKLRCVEGLSLIHI